MHEMWKICTENNNYEVSNMGRVRRRETKRLLKLLPTNTGYYYVALSKNSKGKPVSVH